MIILAIETSCDETAASVVEDGLNVLSNIVFSQTETHKIYGGVVPEIASRMHSESISIVVKQALSEAGLNYKDIDAVAVTYAPGLIGALLTGIAFAKGLAFSLNKPLIPVHHLRAHVAANYIAHKDLKPPFICLIASGGHSHITEVIDYTEFKVLGRTRDDAAGEAFDKTARILGLSYPGGAAIDALSKEGNPNAIKLPRVTFKDNPYDFSFSGVKTAVNNLVHNLKQKNSEINTADIAASFNKTVCETLCDKLLQAAKDKDYKTVALSGGVAANSYLRDYLLNLCRNNEIKLYMPPLNLCGDNAAMVGAQSYFEFQKGFIAKTDLNGFATLDICQNFTI